MVDGKTTEGLHWDIRLTDYLYYFTTETSESKGDLTNKSSLWSIKSCERLIYIILQKHNVNKLSLRCFILHSDKLLLSRPQACTSKINCRWYQHRSSVSSCLARPLQTINSTDINIRVSVNLCDIREKRSPEHSLGVWLNSTVAPRAITVKSF